MTKQQEAVINLTRDLVALWENPKIAALPRSERNAAIDDTRKALIAAVHDMDKRA